MFKIEILRSKWGGFDEARQSLELDTAIDVALTGDMRLRIGGRHGTFEDVWLPWISSSLSSVVHALQNPNNSLASWDVLIPDYDTHIGLKRVSDKIQVSWLVARRQRLTAVTLPAKAVIDEIDKFDRHVCAKIAAAEPKLRWHIRRRRAPQSVGNHKFTVIRRPGAWSED